MRSLPTRCIWACQTPWLVSRLLGPAHDSTPGHWLAQANPKYHPDLARPSRQLDNANLEALPRPITFGCWTRGTTEKVHMTTCTRMPPWGRMSWISWTTKAFQRPEFWATAWAARPSWLAQLTRRFDRIVVADITARAYVPHHGPIFDALLATCPSEALAREDIERDLRASLNNDPCWCLSHEGLHNEERGFAWRFNVPVLQAALKDVVGQIDLSVNTLPALVRERKRLRKRRRLGTTGSTVLAHGPPHH